MRGGRSDLGAPAGLDGPWLAAILDVLDDMSKTLVDIRDQQGGAAFREPVKIQEPAPDLPPHVEAATAVAPPARAGRGASADAWRAWADHANVTVPDGASRADIIAACEQAGVLAKEQ